MKFPTVAPMFPPVALSPAECSRYEQLAQGLVGDTLAEYDLYNGPQQRQVSKKLWKPVKSRENITVYKDRNYDPDDNLHRGLASGISLSAATSTSSSGNRRMHVASATSRSSSSISSQSSSSLSAAILDSIPAEEWNLPKLLMVGTVSGTLDDVMYGLATPDAGLMLLKAHYAQDEVIDGQVLAQIQGPSAAEPYRFLGLKWLVKGNPPAVNALVLPRDLVILDTTGITTDPVSGERIGYFLMHSVNLPTCPDLPKKAAVRGRISSCYIFRELPNGIVDVYMKGFVEASGKIADAVAIISAANGLLCCWKAVVCAQSKKLVWLLKTRLRENKRRINGSSASDTSWPLQGDFQQQQQQLAPHCGMCSKSFKMYSRIACCQLCGAAMCSRCRVTMKLAFPRPGEKAIRLKSVVVCKGCITSSHQQSTFEVAQQEVLSGRFGSVYSSGSSDSRPSARSSSTSSIRASGDTVASNKASTVSISSVAFATPENDTSLILLAQAQEYAQSSVTGAGGTILHAHAQDRKVAQDRKTSDGAAYLSSLSVSSSVADTTKSSMASDYNSYYSDTGGYDSVDDQPQSEDDAAEPFIIDADGGITSDWSAVSPRARQKYLDTVQGRTPEEQAMWKRMAQLHLQAESLYQFTRKTTKSIYGLQGNPTGVMVPPASCSLSPRMSID